MPNKFQSIVKIICPNSKKDIMKQLAVTINWLIGGSAKVAKKDKNLAQLLQQIAMILFSTKKCNDSIFTQYNSPFFPPPHCELLIVNYHL